MPDRLTPLIIMILASGSASRMRTQLSTPFMTGMSTSMKTMSKLVRRARSTA
jgi:hypothetical protein